MLAWDVIVAFRDLSLSQPFHCGVPDQFPVKKLFLSDKNPAFETQFDLQGDLDEILSFPRDLNLLF